MNSFETETLNGNLEDRGRGGKHPPILGTDVLSCGVEDESWSPKGPEQSEHRSVCVLTLHADTTAVFISLSRKPSSFRAVADPAPSGASSN
ncbi:hypothetical protein PoB_006460200 [Plakobranchus ocellatus]|uniref:Uncharacterized protein n=1 Tax=Plakobranchus ocellatus TaxID=259542 RepID=A0AAV4D1R8_9GAST|nr:hypothetical protein PoB_006460200 [Plakobranchus ocellatus]